MRPCFVCYGEGTIDEYDDDDETVIGKEDCYQCEGTGEVEDVCYCHAFCSCECICGAWDDRRCDCWEV